MEQQPDTTIRQRQTRTERTFIEHTGNWYAAMHDYEAGARIWLDVGDHKQAIRTMSRSASSEDGTPLILFTMRDSNGRHVAYSNLAKDDLTWYEEVFR